MYQGPHSNVSLPSHPLPSLSNQNGPLSVCTLKPPALVTVNPAFYPNVLTNHQRLRVHTAPPRFSRTLGVSHPQYSSCLCQYAHRINDDFGHGLDIALLCHCDVRMAQRLLNDEIRNTVAMKFSCNPAAESVPALPYEFLCRQLGQDNP